MTITVQELASFVLNREATTGQDFEQARLPMLGGCEVCGASIAAYNAYPSKSGYLRCADDIGDSGWEVITDAAAGVFGNA